MDVDNDAKKVIWSLQNNKRSEVERNAFVSTGKKPIRKEIKYFVVSFFVMFLLSYLLTQFSSENEEICVTEDFCFFSKDSVLLFTLYVFVNIMIVISAIAFAYFIGKKLGNLKN